MSKSENQITLEILNWYAKMADVYKTMSDTDREEFDEWERAQKMIEPSVDITNWPGWERYIGKKPTRF
jgi:hypothetical protein